MLVSKAAILKGFLSVIIGFLIHINMGLDTKIMSLSILETEL